MSAPGQRVADEDGIVPGGVELPVGFEGDPQAWQIARTCAREAEAVARAKRINLSFDDVDAYVRAFGENMPDARPSMLLDHLARRPSEIDAINGMVPVVAAEEGLPAPYNEVVTAIVRSREAEFEHDPDSG